MATFRDGECVPCLCVWGTLWPELPLIPSPALGAEVNACSKYLQGFGIWSKKFNAVVFIYLEMIVFRRHRLGANPSRFYLHEATLMNMNYLGAKVAA